MKRSWREWTRSLRVRALRSASRFCAPPPPAASRSWATSRSSPASRAVEEVGPDSPLGLQVGDRVTTLVSLTLTPLVIEDGLARWDGTTEQVPADGYAVLFGRSIVAVIPDDLPAELSLSVMDVCGAPP